MNRNAGDDSIVRYRNGALYTDFRTFNTEPDPIFLDLTLFSPEAFWKTCASVSKL